MESPFGKHILAEYFECECTYLDNESAIRTLMLEAASRSGASVAGNIFHHFSPQGVTGVVVVAESHLAIHTWPEFNYASVDIFTCGTRVDPWIGFEYIRDKLQSRKWVTKEIMRGIAEEEAASHLRAVSG